MAPPTTVPPITTAPIIEPPLPTTAAPPLGQTQPPVAAVTEDGDAVIITATGTETLDEGTFWGPTDPLPEEGPILRVAGVALNRDLSWVLVGICCEPSPGFTTQEAWPHDEDDPEPEGWPGHAPALDPSETRFATVTVDGVGVEHLTDGDTGSIDLPGAHDVVWVSDSRFVALTSSESATTLQAVDVMSDGTLQLGPSRLVAPYPVRDPAVVGYAMEVIGLAGVADGAVYIRSLANDRLTAHDAGTLEALPSLDVMLPTNDTISAWWQDGQLRWIDAERVLRIGDREMPGRYIWVR